MLSGNNLILTAQYTLATQLALFAGYTKQDLDFLGSDIVSNMMSTGNPIPRVKSAITNAAAANNKNSTTVVADMSCGYGHDSLLVSDLLLNNNSVNGTHGNGSSTSAGGRVIGVDIDDAKIVKAMNTAYNTRKVFNVDFRVGDTADPPIADGTCDVVISNGGYCHVPDHAKAFKSAYRILKSGGGVLSATFTARIKDSIVITTKDKDGEQQKQEWPEMAKGFAFMSDLEGFLKDAGFTDVQVGRVIESDEEHERLMNLRTVNKFGEDFKVKLGIEPDTTNNTSSASVDEDTAKMYERFRQIYKIRSCIGPVYIYGKKN